MTLEPDSNNKSSQDKPEAQRVPPRLPAAQPAVIGSAAPPFQIQTRDSLALTNSSGQELHNCVIAVRLSNAAGDSYLNLYFVPDWQAYEKRVARYSNIDFPIDTVDGIVRVDVSLWSKECSIKPIVLNKPPAGWPEPE